VSDASWAIAIMQSTQKVNDTLVARITAIRELHISTPFDKHFICKVCQEYWPCETIVLLEGN